MACALPWHLGKGLSHLTSCTFRCRSVFISLIEIFNESHIFTSFVFPDQYLKPKESSEKWPTSFLEPASQAACLHDITFGKRVKCLMPYSLLASHCRQCRDCLRCPRQSGLVTRLSGQQEALGLVVRGLVACACPPRTLQSQLLQERLLSSGTWCHQKTGLLLLISGMVDLRGPGPHIAGGWHVPVSPGDGRCLPQPGFGPLSAHTACLLWFELAFPSHCPLGRSIWVLSLGKNLGLLVLGKGCEGKKGQVCWVGGCQLGLEMSSCSFHFCVLAVWIARLTDVCSTIPVLKVITK